MVSARTAQAAAVGDRRVNSFIFNLYLFLDGPHYGPTLVDH
jgi:hypothetical protein